RAGASRHVALASAALVRSARRRPSRRGRFCRLALPLPPTPTLFPYTTLFRSRAFDEALRPLGLTHGQFSLLMSLNRPAPPSIGRDRKSTRLNSSHRTISYAVFCLKKKS